MTEQELQLFFLDVGHGDTILGLFPQGNSCFIVDVADADATRKALSNIPEIEFILLTHTHIDHAGGLHAFVNSSNVLPKAIYVNYDRGPSSRSAERYKMLLEHLLPLFKHYGIDVQPVHSGVTLGRHGVEIEALAPGYAFLGHCISKNQINDASVVLKIEFQGNRVLLTGDIEDDGVDELIDADKANKLCNIDIIKIPHHGGITLKACSKLLDVLDPDYAVICLAKNNKYGHPSQDIIELLEEKGITIVYTYDHQNEPHTSFVLGKAGITLKT